MSDRPAGTGAVIRSVLGNTELRRVSAAYAAFIAAEFGTWVAILVYAYEESGNDGVAVAIAVQLVPATLFAPIAGALADRYRPVRVLTAGYVVQGAALLATAAALATGGAFTVVLVAAAVASTSMTVTRPTQAVILPGLARRPVELTAVNVVTTWLESAAVFLAPALAGVLLAASGPALVFAPAGAVVLLGAILVATVHAGPRRVQAPGSSAFGDAGRQVAAGMGALRRHRPARLVMLLVGAQLVAYGALDVLAVVLAIDVLDLGSGGAGYLSGAFGLGGVAGAAAAVALVGRRRLAPALAASLLVWGTAFVALGVDTRVAEAFALIAVAGGARSVLEVAGRTLLQRAAPADVLASLFGILEGVEMGALAVGSLVTPLLISLGGVETAFTVIGVFLLVLLVTRFRALLRVDAEASVPVVEVTLLRSIPIFAALPPAAIDGLARAADPIEFAPGATVIRQGDVGDRYYAIVSGEVVVEVDGRPVRTMGRGEGFGEIALLRPSPRTATVIAVDALELLGIDGPTFVVALTGHAPSAAAADALMRELDT